MYLCIQVFRRCTDNVFAIFQHKYSNEQKFPLGSGFSLHLYILSPGEKSLMFSSFRCISRICCDSNIFRNCTNEQVCKSSKLLSREIVYNIYRKDGCAHENIWYLFDLIRLLPRGMAECTYQIRRIFRDALFMILQQMWPMSPRIDNCIIYTWDRG